MMPKLKDLPFLVLAGTLSACAALAPGSVDIDTRLAGFPTENLPLESDVRIYWNDYQVPYIEAGTDRDLAFTLGLVHAHLRGGQLALFKRLSQGRVSESAGPFTRDIDHALRILDLGYAAPQIVAGWPEATRAWMQAFVDGLNHYQDTAEGRPPEFGLLGLSDEPWTPEDLIAIGRLAGADVNWLSYFALLDRRLESDWTEVWARALTSGSTLPQELAAADDDPKARALAAILAGFSRSGSNSIVVAPSRSEGGGAMIANDPHLGQSLPNFWLLAGLRSPSVNAVGMMVPGLPFIALGRNEDMAWGGTNLRAASSDLYDVSGLEAADFETREERIRTRFWFDREVRIRRSRLGPIISDSSFVNGRPGEVIALRWVGHTPTDEITAFLLANRARTPQEFRAAFADYAVSAQNMLFADRDGNIGMILATQQPTRPPGPPADLVLEGTLATEDWNDFANAQTLPWVLNPAEGFIASGNNEPAHADRPMGYFFTPDDRVARMAEIIGGAGRVGIDDLITLQTDVISAPARALAQGIVAQFDRTGTPLAPDVHRTLTAWDGSYAADARGPVVFETLLFHLARNLYGQGEENEVPSVYAQWSHLQRFLIADIEALGPAAGETLAGAAAAALPEAAKYATWGDMHALAVGHILSNLPVIGGRFRLDRFPSGGSRETLMKTAHGLVNTPHASSYGSQARHISDLGDANANHFVLFGGQDGWLGSRNFADQVALWRRAAYIRIPLEADAARAAFPRHMLLRP